MPDGLEGFLVETSLDEFRSALDRHVFSSAAMTQDGCQVVVPLTAEQEAFLAARERLAAAGFAMGDGRLSQVAIVDPTWSYKVAIQLADELIGEAGVFQLRFPKGKETLDFGAIDTAVGHGISVDDSIREFEIKLCIFARAIANGQIEPGIYASPPGTKTREFSGTDGAKVVLALPEGNAVEDETDSKPVLTGALIQSLNTTRGQQIHLRYDAEGALLRADIVELGERYCLTCQNGESTKWLDSRTNQVRELEIEQAVSSVAFESAEVSILDLDQPRLSRLFAFTDKPQPELVCQMFQGLFAEISAKLKTAGQNPGSNPDS